jgi:hypothetical protein
MSELVNEQEDVMRNLRVFESISVDGYFNDADGGMSWAHAGREDPEFAD